jgi:hypothetical protein
MWVRPVLGELALTTWSPADSLSRYVGVRGDLGATVTAATEDW